ncbi:MAG: four helix bundle protein [Candidatus Omnitrophica bacterium]|nr:four helix bundle protein [Candidatus Omnitrophota bacterium]
MAFKFEKLKVWQRALNFDLEIHDTTRYFPKEEIYILTSQIKRATDSVVLNIAEGSTGQSNSEFRQFLGYAIRSAVEVVACLYISRKRHLIDNNKFKDLYAELEIIIKMLQKLRSFLNK